MKLGEFELLLLFQSLQCSAMIVVGIFHGRGKPWWAGKLLAKAIVEDIVGSDGNRSADESVSGRRRWLRR